MTTKRTLLVAGAVSAIVLSAPLANAVALRPLIVTDPTGSVRIQQGMPCGDDLDITRPIVAGRIEVTPMTIEPDTRDPQISFNRGSQGVVTVSGRHPLARRPSSSPSWAG